LRQFARVRHQCFACGHAGLATESVRRCFTQLRKRGVIRLESAQKVAIADRDALIWLTGCGDRPPEPSTAVL
jgi:Crp-like helix-turn-helix domain